MVPEPIFTLFGRDVYLYGVFIALGLIACMVVFFLYTTKKKVPEKLQDFVFFVAVIAIALGFLSAMLYQAVYNWIETGYFNFYTAGLTVMGGIVGGVAVFLIVYFGVGKFLFKGKEKDLHIKHFGDILSVAPMCITIAHAFGRLGCLMSGCCHGAYLDDQPVFGGIYMDTVDDGAGYFVPTQLYESIFLFLLFAVLSVLYFKNCRITMHIYLIAYGIWRIIIEFFRTDDRGAFILGLSPSQWQSIAFIVAGVALIVFYVVKKWKFFAPKDEENIVEDKTEIKLEN